MRYSSPTAARARPRPEGPSGDRARIRCHWGRIDTFGLDENGSRVVIEFKKGTDSGIVSQALSCMAWLDSAHHEFEALVRRVLGVEAAEPVDGRRRGWSASRPVSLTTSGWPCSGFPGRSTWCTIGCSRAVC
ncbi:hypothetical protein ACFCV8_16840 [Streptomyces sp. NPDC056347]|uniref:hypothetical protein n=1 Tax=Streptomyces sp. NPDC056347 TaxID=3345790 RepID=UPI0035D7B4E5